MTTKSELREEYIQTRKSLSDEFIKNAEKRVISFVDSNKEKFKDKKIASYWSINNEMPTENLTKTLIGMNSEVYLPKIVQNSKVMEFRKLDDYKNLKANIFNILEPLETQQIEASDLDIILLPCVCFDTNGYRIGMGKGYYDHSLVNLENSNTEFVIIAYDFQKVESCYQNKYDIKAHSCITDEYFYTFK